MNQWTFHANRTHPARKWLLASLALLVLGIVCLLGSAQSWNAYRKSNRFYAKLSSLAVEEIPSDAQGSRVNFAALKEINPDTAAWLEVPGLELSLPVVQAEDNKTYLHTGFDGQKNPNGCLFFSASSQSSVDDLYRVVYGHNIHDGAMFGRLTDYKDETFAQENATFTLCTPAGDKTCRIFSCHEVTDGEEVYAVDWQPGQAYNEFLQGLQEDSLVDFGTQVPENSRVITLSTCASSYGNNLKRLAVHAVVEEED